MQGLEPFDRRVLHVSSENWSFLDDPKRLDDLERFRRENPEAVVGESIEILERYLSKNPKTTLIESHMYNDNNVWRALKRTYEMRECLRALRQVCEQGHDALKDWRVVLFAIFAVHEYDELLGELKDFLLQDPGSGETSERSTSTETFSSIFPSIWEYVRTACGGALDPIQFGSRWRYGPVMTTHYFGENAWSTRNHVYSAYTESRAFRNRVSEWMPLSIPERNELRRNRTTTNEQFQESLADKQNTILK